MTVADLVAPARAHVYGKRWPHPGMSFPQADTSTLKILTEVDPRSWMWPALNQLQIGSCTANATSRCFRADAHMDGHDCGELSRRWIYHFEMAIEGTLGQGDVGAIGHDAFTVAKHGIPDEALYPYSDNIEDFEIKPPDVEPRAYRLGKPVRSVPQTLEAIKQVLSNRQTIPLGFTVYESFEDTSWWASGEMPIPAPGEEILGGHEVLACGYLKEYPHHILMLNSWDTSFGIGGYFLMPLAYVLDRSRVSDLRTIQRPAGK
jgi:C1A family cysteine protease